MVALMLGYRMDSATELQRLREVVKRVNDWPLGSGALVGGLFGIDQDAITKEPGFKLTINNFMAVVTDRDFVVRTL